MQRISVVFQDVYLFDSTIEENIRLGRPDASDAEVRAAAALARVDEIAERPTEDWGARVGDGRRASPAASASGSRLPESSSRDAQIVLLDEATAALDPINERAVQQALRALNHHKTLVVVAHRLQTVQAADQILVLDQGQIVERGSHSELLEFSGRYVSFWQERVRAAGWRVAPEELGRSTSEIAAD